MTTAKEHGMLYKSEMVQAILREIDPKEQTRRPVTFANSLTGGAVKRKEWHLLDWDNAVLHVMEKMRYTDVPHASIEGLTDSYAKLEKWPEWHVPFKGGIVEVRPRVMPSDLIWVREHWGYHGSTTVQKDGKSVCHMHAHYHADNSDRDVYFESEKEMHDAPPHQNLKYPDGYDELDIYEQVRIKNDLLTAWWRRAKSIPAIHMPRWASRINLNVTGMRSQRIQEISEHDAKAEGATKAHLPDLGQTWATYKQGFEYLWDSINTERGFPWAGNHPVWIHDFKRINKEGANG